MPDKNKRLADLEQVADRVEQEPQRITVIEVIKDYGDYTETEIFNIGGIGQDDER